MATEYIREWIQFFTGCGIPDDVAAMYALIFYENRIQKNMLLDLNKEYLRDMGITITGNVIAILRHAKVVHEKYLKSQILSNEDGFVVEESNLTNESSPAVKKSTPMKRILEHYTRKYNSSETEPVTEVQVILPIDKVTGLSKTGGEKIGTPVSLKKKIQITSTDKELKEKGLEVPVPKVRRVLPENEGRYKIKMPSGTTERSKKLLEIAKKRKAKTVFDRLGESSVSSTTSEISIISSTSSSPLTREKKSSVFSRLGEKTSIVSSTSSADDLETLPSDSLPYAGILKPAVQKKNLSNVTMRADEQQQSEVNKVKKGISVKKRLGVTKPAQTTTQNRVMLKAARRIGEGQALVTSSKFNSQVEAKSNNEVVVSNNFRANNIHLKQKTPNTTNQAQKTKLISLKRKIDANSDVSPLKKVRFGSTTHRLIPATSTSAVPTNYVKNYPKLTMVINNRNSNAENKTLSSGIKLGSLNSDNLSGRIGVKSRIGNKLLKGRLGKEAVKVGKSNSFIRKASTVKDRLG